jgi:hypothetical protein
MSPAVFVHELAETAPTVADLLALGLNADEAASWAAAYHLAPRACPLTLEYQPQDEALMLVLTYDVGSLEVGMVSFLDCPKPLGASVQFAVVEMDLMVLTEAGEVVVVDWECPTHVMWQCAADGAHLLQALLLASRFLTLTMLDKAISNDDQFALGVARSVGEAAGGPEYESFYQMLFGV